MIILDTNVLSEVMRSTPDVGVLSWLQGQPRSALFTTTTQGELFYGLRLLDDGQRKVKLFEAIQSVFLIDMVGKVLSFDTDAADAYGLIASERKRAGRPISQFDAMIAAITLSRGARLATRNAKDFADCGISVIDPWHISGKK